MVNKEQLRRSTFLKKVVKEAANQADLEKLIEEVKKFKNKLSKPNDMTEFASEYLMVALTDFKQLQDPVKHSTYLKLGASADIKSAVYACVEYVSLAFMTLATIECGKMILQKKEFSSKVSNKALDAVSNATQKLVNLYKHVVEIGNKVKSLLKDRIAELQQAKTVSPETVKKLTDALTTFIDAGEKSDRYRQVIAYKAASTVVQQLQKKYPR